jgi:hypothetical protein
VKLSKGKVSFYGLNVSSSRVLVLFFIRTYGIEEQEPLSWLLFALTHRYQGRESILGIKAQRSMF